MMPKIIPPFLVGFFLVLMIPTTLLCSGVPMLPAPYQWGGLIVVAAGLAVLMAGHRLFMARDVEIHTFKTPRNLVTSGIYQASRNPMYLGFFLILFGAAIVSNETLNVLYALAFFMAANFWYIPVEEQNAVEAFGTPYDDYRDRVRRWL